MGIRVPFILQGSRVGLVGLGEGSWKFYFISRYMFVTRLLYGG